MSDFLTFLALIGTELYDLFVHYKSGASSEEEAQRLAMRVARRVSDELAKKDIVTP